MSAVRRIAHGVGCGVAALVLLGISSRVEAQTGSALVGRVSAEARGLDAAKVYAYDLASQALHKVNTDASGQFRFEPLPSGLYKVIAFKAGFQPVIVMISRTVAQATSSLAQVVEMELAKAGEGGAQDFWSLRGQVPSDVLRDIEGERFAKNQEREAARPGATSSVATVDPSRFGASMMAMRGVSGSPEQPNETLQGRLGVDAVVGETSIDFQGRYTSLGEATGATGGGSIREGQATTLAVRLENQEQGNLSVSALNHRMTLQRGSKESQAMLDHYDVEWARDFGAAKSSLRAEYTDENYLFGRGAARSTATTDASRTLRIEGSYMEDFDRHSIEAGLRYRQRDAFVLDQGLLTPAFGSERVDVFGRGGFRVTPTVMLEYGLFTTLQDGAVSLTPRGGVVIQLTPRWQASGFYSERVQAQAGGDRADFMPTLRERQDDFAAASTREIQLEVSRILGQSDEKLTVSAVHRQFGDNLRVYFGEDLFDFLQNVYLVPGDTLPELQMSVSRRITPAILTKVESSYAVGGGGLVEIGSGRSFENDVRYLLTSVDTRFLPTSTGVFLAFHRLEQDLLPLAVTRGRGSRSELESLELVLTQDLSVLLDLAADWSVRFDVEFTRGTDPLRPYLTDGSHRILGGVAIKF